MNPDDIVGIVERIAELLTPGAQRAWEIAVRQVSAQAIAYLVWAVVGIVGTVVTAVLIVKACRRMCDITSWWFTSDVSVVAMLGLIVSLVVLFAVGSTNLNNAILYLVNPEYQAIRILLGLVGH